MKRKAVVAGLIAVFVIVAGYLVFKIYATREFRQELATAVERTPGIRQLEYSGLDLAPLRSRARARDVRVTFDGYRDALAIGEIIVEDVAYVQSTPTRLHVTMRGIEVNPDLDLFSELKAPLAELGYTHLDAKLELAYRYDAQDKTLEISPLIFEADGFGRGRLEIRIVNCDLTAIVQNGARIGVRQILWTLPTLALADAEVTFEDHSVVERYIQAEAKRRQQSPQVFQNLWAKQTQIRLKPFFNETENASGRAIGAFIQDPNRITAIVAPPQPVTLFNLILAGDAEQIARLLHITVKR